MAALSSDSVSSQTIVLRYENEGGRVRIVPPDRDVMAMSVEMAIEACRAFREQIRFKDQFDLLLKRLAEWVDQHLGAVHQAYLTRRDSGLLFLVVLNSRQFDHVIEDSLTELDLEIANNDDFGLITMSVHTLPLSSPETVSAFVSPKQCLEFRRDAQRS